MELALSPAAWTFAAVLGAASAAALAVAVARWRRHGPWPAHEPRRPAPWTATDTLLVLSAYVVLHVAPALVQQRDDEKNGVVPSVEPTISLAEELQSHRATILAASALSLLTATLAVAVLRFRAGATAADLGLVRGELARDVALGAKAFLVAALPVYGVQWAAQSLFTPRPHRIIELLVERPEPGLFALCVVSAAVVAPMVEEVLFRLVFQGWLEAAEVRNTAPPGTGDVADTRPPWLSLVVPAALFAAMHYASWPDPLPLFVFGLALGWLYRRTHRLLPCIVLHMCLNAASMLMLGLSLPWK